MRRYSYALPRRRTVRSGRWCKGYRLIPPQLILQRGRLRLTAPALTAVDLAGDVETGGEAIDRVLRSRAGSLDPLWEAFALQPNRPGNQTRAALLHDSRNSPWSEGERRLHRLLRQHRVTGWWTNVWLPVDGGGYFVDILFRSQRLIVDFDGWTYHGDRKAFDDDRRRRNELVLTGFRVINITWRQLEEDPESLLRCVRRGLDPSNPG